MEHVRQNWRSYLLALMLISVLTILCYVVLGPMLGVALHTISPIKVFVVLLVTGALLRYLLHSVDKVDQTHIEASVHGRTQI